MDIEKLKSLSCLELTTEEQKSISQSLKEVWVNIEKIKELDIPNQEKNPPKNTIFTSEQSNVPMFDIDNPPKGIKAQDGSFETTRVVNKK